MDVPAQNFSQATFSTPHLQVIGHVLAAKANSLEFLQSSCLVMAFTGSVTASSSMLASILHIDFCRKMVTSIWIKTKMLLMAPCGGRQCGHLKWLPLFNLTCSGGDLCVHVSVFVCFLYATNGSFFSLGVCRGFSPFAPCQLASSVLTVLPGLLILNSYGFVVT